MTSSYSRPASTRKTGNQGFSNGWPLRSWYVATEMVSPLRSKVMSLADVATRRPPSSLKFLREISAASLAMPGRRIVTILRFSSCLSFATSSGERGPRSPKSAMIRSATVSSAPVVRTAAFATRSTATHMPASQLRTPTSTPRRMSRPPSRQGTGAPCTRYVPLPRSQ